MIIVPIMLGASSAPMAYDHDSFLRSSPDARTCFPDHAWILRPISIRHICNPSRNIPFHMPLQRHLAMSLISNSPASMAHGPEAIQATIPMPLAEGASFQLHDE